MKFNKFFFAALALGMMASCSDKGEDENTSTYDPNGEGYISFQLTLPVNNTGTRAENDNFNDGSATEYAVQNATLVLFEGTAENTATLASAYDLNTRWNTEGTTIDQITVVSKIVQKVKNPTVSTNNFYAYVILNRPANITVDDGVLKKNDGGTWTSLAGKNIAAVSDIIVNDEINNANIIKGTGFITMTNAPLAKAHGSDTAIPSDEGYSVLPVIIPSKIKATAAEAQADPACDVYVERNVAKVTLRATTTGSTSSEGLSYTINGWLLDNTSKNAYLNRKVTDYSTSWYKSYSNLVAAGYVSEQFRFVGNNPTKTGETAYRIYWAIDPCYNTTYDLTDATQKANYEAEFTQTVTESSTFESSSISTVSNYVPQYCYENTFDVAHQIERYTTRAVVKATFNSGASFYTLNNDGTNILETKAKVEAAVKNAFLTDGTILAALSTLGTSTDEDNIDVTLSADKAGTITVEAILAKDKVEPSNTAKQYNASSTDLVRLNAALQIQYYEGGAAYYRILIKHFGDNLTPWSDAAHLTTAAYADNATTLAGDISGATIDRYLGRYGVVRNNWYDLEVEGIKALGSPTVPDVTNTDTDDKVESYIAVKINILSWAKRTQSEWLK